MADVFNGEKESDGRYIYSVSELTREIKVLLETTIPTIWVEGEISNFKLHSSGHMYLSLKDEDAQISAVFWRGRNKGLPFTPEDGMKVIAQGRVTVYEKRGSYQLDIFKLHPAGIGALQLAFEQLKKRLFEEGLFEDTHKKPLPLYPERIGIVTSPTGAAIRDLYSICSRRLPQIQLVILPVSVQGDGAAEDIAQAIDEFNEFGAVDVLIVGRGGGSLEDLWAFNEEIVARAIFRSFIPVVSAVGHEIDFTISDFVADLRAPTPSAAAELVVPDGKELMLSLNGAMTRTLQHLKNKIAREIERLEGIKNSYGFKRPDDIVHQYQQRLDEFTRLAGTNISHILALAAQRYRALHARLVSLGPESVLSRGYSICYRLDDKEVLLDSAALRVAAQVGVQFYKGRARVSVTEIEEEGTVSSLMRK